jgi:signal transduction histidine kinase
MTLMIEDPGPEAPERRILILAPSRRDAPTAAAILERAHIHHEICADASILCARLNAGAGAALIAEEALAKESELALLLSCLEDQPPWSEPPIVLVTAGHLRTAGRTGLDRFVGFGNVMLLERPLRSATLVSAMRSALVARGRQYQVRDYLRERERTEERLRAQEQELLRLNETLEQRVRERTAELEEANRRLLAEMQHRQHAERALLQAQKMEAIGRLTGGIAHDFNNLLMVLSGGLDMLERTGDPTRRDRLLAGMRQAANRGEVLTRQLLAFSRRMALSPGPVHLPALLEGMRIIVAGALRENIQIDIRMPEDLWPVMADAAQLELVVLNLAVNARDAMPQGGTLTIEAFNTRLGPADGELSGDFVAVEVRDTGAGIPPEILDRVFDPFFTTKEVGKGTGLGLSQVYGFTTQSGGRVSIRSRLGEGTSIILHLPRAAAAPAMERLAAPSPRDAVGSTDRQVTVLLVEDNDEVAALTSEMLRGLGFRVQRTASAAAALRLLEEGAAADLVLSDIVMPGMSGVELAAALKMRRPDLPVILTTGYSDAIGDSKAVEGFRLLTKPYRIETLEAALNAVCAPELRRS